MTKPAETGVGAQANKGSQWHGLLACPRCGRDLDESGERLKCPGCSESWPVIDGVPHFIESFPYWGEVSQSSMQAVNRAAGTIGWKAALLESPDQDVQHASTMMLNLDRANWHWLADLPPTSRVLDFGAGTGTTAHALGLQYGEVVAVEPGLERVEFMRHRFTQEGLQNVKVVRSSIWELPFAPGSFDLVAMNGVLEWVAEGRHGDPYGLQEAALRKAYELLRPGGCLYVGIENRLSAGLFVGYPDPHCGLPWVTVLPRRLAQWYARRHGLPGGYRNYLYSSRGYQKLMRSAGFCRSEVYLALPSYNYPRFFVPMAGDLFSRYSRQFATPPAGRMRKTIGSVLSRIKVLKYVQYSFAILAYKGL